MLDLDEQLAQLVDAVAEPVTHDEARRRAGRRVARRRVGLGALVAVLIAGVAGVVIARPHEASSGRVNVASSDSSSLGMLSAPRLGLDAAVAEGVDRETLRRGPGHLPESARPGEAGAVIITGNRTVYGHELYNINLLQRGDRITITSDAGAITTYEVTKSGDLFRPWEDVLAAPTCCTANHTLYLLAPSPPYSKQWTWVVEAVQVGS